MRKYSFIKILFSIIILKFHRYAFDEIYVQHGKIGFKKRIILIIYKLLVKMIPDFRPYLKKWKPILTKGYNQQKLTVGQQICFLHLKPLNVIRYSPYW